MTQMNLGYFIVGCWLLALNFPLAAQIQQPVNWQFAVKKTGQQEYAVCARTIIQEGWHIYASHMEEGKLGGPLPSSVTLAEVEGVTLIDSLVERGKPVEKYVEVFDMQVRYYADTVDFIQRLRVSNANVHRLKGTVEYMACTDEQCLPPEEVAFTVRLDKVPR